MKMESKNKIYKRAIYIIMINVIKLILASNIVKWQSMKKYDAFLYYYKDRKLQLLHYTYIMIVIYMVMCGDF